MRFGGVHLARSFKCTRHLDTEVAQYGRARLRRVMVEKYVVAMSPQVWLLDPDSKRAYTVTKTDGLREFKGEILQIADPPLEMDLRTIFD